MTEDLSQLSPAETDVLRLLAAGHTVKSIAVQLGRTEGSINERLREARRKTGAASSRELARRVMADMPPQENCDQFIDLPPTPPEVPPANTPSPASRRAWWIGGTIMVLGLVLAGALALGGVPGAGNRISDFHVQNSPELTQYLADTDAQTREHERQFQAQLGTSPTDHTSMRISNEVMNFMQKNALNGKVDVACGATMCRAFSKLNFSKAHSTTEKTMEDLQDIYLKFGSRSYFRMANHSMSFAADGIQVNQQGNGSQDVLLLSYWRRRS